MEYYDDPKTKDLLTHAVFGFIVVMIIALPNFVCKVSDEDFVKFKKDFTDRNVNSYLLEVGKMMDNEKFKK